MKLWCWLPNTFKAGRKRKDSWIPWNSGLLSHSAISNRVGRSRQERAHGVLEWASNRYLAQYTKSDFVITRTITDRIGRHELLSQLLNQQEVGRVVVIYDNHKLFRPRAVETDAFSASFFKSKGLTSSRRQFPEGYVFPLARSGKLKPRKHNGLQGKKALYILILQKIITYSKGLLCPSPNLLSMSLFTTGHSFDLSPYIVS